MIPYIPEPSRIMIKYYHRWRVEASVTSWVALAVVASAFGYLHPWFAAQRMGRLFGWSQQTRDAQMLHILLKQCL